MPQDIVFPVPMPRRINPHYQSCFEGTKQWLQEFGVTKDPKAVYRYAAVDTTYLAANWFPDVSAQNLRIIADGIGLVVVMDDQFDGSWQEQPGVISQLVTELDAITTAPTTPSCPIAAAWSDLWSRMSAGTSSAWQARARDGWIGFYAAFQDEEVYRSSRTVPEFDEFMKLRRYSGYMPAVIPLVERLDEYELPARTLEMDPLRRMVDLVADIIDTANDVHSLEKEEIRGDPQNMVMVIAQRDGCSRDEALRRTIKMINAWIREFCDAHYRIDGMCRRLQLSDRETNDVGRNVEGLRRLVRGYLDWGARTPRYLSAGIPPQSQRAAEEDVVSPRQGPLLDH